MERYLTGFRRGSLSDKTRSMSTAGSLRRFIVAQNITKNSKTCFEIAKGELYKGKKYSHWMWFIFPQLDGLGSSYMSKEYALRGVEEAEQYLQNEILRE